MHERRALRSGHGIQEVFDPGPRATLQSGLAGDLERTTCPVQALVQGEGFGVDR
jgi:hypothetical protein